MFNLYFDVYLLIPLGTEQDTLARKRKSEYRNIRTRTLLLRNPRTRHGLSLCLVADFCFFSAEDLHL